MDLTTPDDHLPSYRDALEFVATQAGRQIHHFAHPIPDMSVIDHDGYDRILARIRDEIGSGRVVYLHCWGGKGARAPRSDASSLTMGWTTGPRSRASHS